MSSSEPAFNMTRWGDIPKLTHPNHDEWNDNSILIVSAMWAYAIVTRDDPEPQLLDFNHDWNHEVRKPKEAKAASMIRLSCSPDVQRIIKGMRTLMGCATHKKPAWTPPDLISADQTSFASSVVADPWRTNHLYHTQPSLVTTLHNWTIQMMQSRIAISAHRYSHHYHHSMRWY